MSDQPSNSGGDEPAFPFGQISELTGQPINGFFAPGLTQRDFIAIEAMKAIIASPRDWTADEEASEPIQSWEDVAKGAFQAAEAFLAERQRRGEKP